MNKSLIICLLFIISICKQGNSQNNELGVDFSILRVYDKNIIEASNPFKFISIKYKRGINQYIGLCFEFKPDIINGNRTSMTVRSMLDSNSLNKICERDGNLHIFNLSIYYKHKFKSLTFLPNVGLGGIKTNDYYLTELVLAPPPLWGKEM